MSRLQDSDHVAIAGSGIIALSTAYRLATDLREAALRTKITIIEPSDKLFAASSANCTGCLHYGFPEEKLRALLPLGKYSFDLWAHEAEDGAFRDVTGYRAQSSFGVGSGAGAELDKLPGWVKKQAGWDVDSNVLGARTATVNPGPLGEWLREKCVDLGVEFRTRLRIIEVHLSAENEVQGLTCEGHDQATHHMDCKQLLLACGPWTPVVYASLFPKSTDQLRATTDAGDWIMFANPCPVSQDSVAFVSFANLVGEKLEFAGRNDGTIWACGRRNPTATLPAPGQADTPDEELIQELCRRSQEFLNWRCDCAQAHSEFRLLSKGRAFRPATETGLPVIAEVRPSELAGNVSRDTRPSQLASGVFMCWGHGSYGLTLGMGSGRLISQLMRGETPDLDLSPFSLSSANRKVALEGQATEAIGAGPGSWLRHVMRWVRLS